MSRIQIFFQIQIHLQIFLVALNALNVKKCASLPSILVKPEVIYDGNDLLYFIGGSTVEGDWEILEYKITSMDIKPIAKFPEKVFFGSAFMSKNGTIFYVGGLTTGRYVHKWRPGQDMATKTDIELPTGYQDGGLAYDGHDSAYLIGGFMGWGPSNAILKFDLRSGNVIPVGTIPINRHLTPGAIWYKGSAYSFGGSDPISWKHIYKFTPDGLDGGRTEILSLELPKGVMTGTSVLINSTVYLIGGITDHGSGSIHGLTRYNIPTGSIEYEYVNDLAGLSVVTGVYVQKSNTIYVVGGHNVLCVAI